MPLAAEAIAALDPARVAAAVRDGESVGIAVAGREHTLTAQDVLLTMKAPEGYSVEREGAHAVALDLTIDESLLREGRSREIVHAVQNARKSAGLEVEDRIELALGGDDSLVLIIVDEVHRGYVASETLAVSLSALPPHDEKFAIGLTATPFSSPDSTRQTHVEHTEIEGLSLEIALRRAEQTSDQA